MRNIEARRLARLAKRKLVLAGATARSYFRWNRRAEAIIAEGREFWNLGLVEYAREVWGLGGQIKRDVKRANRDFAALLLDAQSLYRKAQRVRLGRDASYPMRRENLYILGFEAACVQSEIDFARVCEADLRREAAAMRRDGLDEATVAKMLYVKTRY